MAKKSGKKAGTAVERLAAQLKKRKSEKPAELALELGLTEDRFQEAFEKASPLAGKAPDPRLLVQLPAAFQLAFLQLAEGDRDADLINDFLAMTTEGDVKKEAKRMLHRLRSRGLQVAQAQATGPSVLDRRVVEEEPALPCYITPVTSLGSRMVWISRYVHGGVAVYQAEINDERGLVEFGGGIIGRSRYRDLTKEILEDDKATLLEIPYGEARHQVTQAVAHSRKTSQPIPEGYLEASRQLPEADLFPPPPEARTLFAREAVASDPEQLQKTAELHDHPLFADWIPDEETLKVFHQKLQEIETSQITINEQQRIDQIGRALDQCVAGMLEQPEKRGRYQNRLFEMAAFLQRSGQEEPGRSAAAAAWQLSDEPFEPFSSPFFVRLVRKMFKSPEEIAKRMSQHKAHESAAAEKKPAPETGNLIVPP